MTTANPAVFSLLITACDGPGIAMGNLPVLAGPGLHAGADRVGHTCRTTGVGNEQTSEVLQTSDVWVSPVGWCRLPKSCRLRKSFN